MATDYDAPRRTETDDVSEDSLEELKARRNEAQSAVVDVDESESAESFELPGADLSGEELSVRVVPKQADEFTCSSCFWCITAADWPARRTACTSAPTARRDLTGQLRSAASTRSG